LSDREGEGWKMFIMKPKNCILECERPK
jgi:hypothetical protein